MEKFLYIEGAYLILSGVILLVTLFVVTRPFMTERARKKGLPAVALFLALAIALHYAVTTDRMARVKKSFEEGKPVICENRVIRKGAQSIIIRRSLGWRLEGDYFVSDAYERPFFAARCIEYEK
ncbi:MAG: hypothetical protein GXO33_07265 [Epsilonproteobacteria bacterium]|nr:hypothetical protein [Campylobacterota bacterium]